MRARIVKIVEMLFFQRIVKNADSAPVRANDATIFIGPRSPGPIYVSGCNWVTELGLWNLTDVTLADEDTNSILTDKVNRTIQCNVAMQV